MKIIISILFTFIISTSNAQKVSEDTLMEIVHYAFNSIEEGIPQYATESYSKIISIDSSYYRIYYLRACSQLWDSQMSYSINGVFIHDFNDSTLVRKAILDLKKCIHLYFMKPKSFPENLVGFDKEYKIIEEKKLLGGRYFSQTNQDIIDGVMVYITSKGKNKKLACECWKKVAAEGINSIDILINEFCK